MRQTGVHEVLHTPRVLHCDAVVGWKLLANHSPVGPLALASQLRHLCRRPLKRFNILAVEDAVNDDIAIALEVV